MQTAEDLRRVRPRGVTVLATDFQQAGPDPYDCPQPNQSWMDVDKTSKPYHSVRTGTVAVAAVDTTPTKPVNPTTLARPAAPPTLGGVRVFLSMDL